MHLLNVIWNGYSWKVTVHVLNFYWLFFKTNFFFCFSPNVFNHQIQREPMTFDRMFGVWASLWWKLPPASFLIKIGNQILSFCPKWFKKSLLHCQRRKDSRQNFAVSLKLGNFLSFYYLFHILNWTKFLNVNIFALRLAQMISDRSKIIIH